VTRPLRVSKPQPLHNGTSGIRSGAYSGTRYELPKPLQIAD
jgi:hypothetical protein